MLFNAIGALTDAFVGEYNSSRFVRHWVEALLRFQKIGQVLDGYEWHRLILLAARLNEDYALKQSVDFECPLVITFGNNQIGLCYVTWSNRNLDRLKIRLYLQHMSRTCLKAFTVDDFTIYNH